MKSDRSHLEDSKAALQEVLDRLDDLQGKNSSSPLSKSPKLKPIERKEKGTLSFLHEINRKSSLDMKSMQRFYGSETLKEKDPSQIASNNVTIRDIKEEFKEMRLQRKTSLGELSQDTTRMGSFTERINKTRKTDIEKVGIKEKMRKFELGINRNEDVSSLFGVSTLGTPTFNNNKLTELGSTSQTSRIYLQPPMKFENVFQKLNTEENRARSNTKEITFKKNLSSFSKEIEKFKGQETQENNKCTENDIFAKDTSTFFKINPQNTRLKEFKRLYEGVESQLEDPTTSSPKIHPEIWKAMKDLDLSTLNEKAIAVIFSSGKTLLQPAYMKRIGTMCYTELWSSKESARTSVALRNKISSIKLLPKRDSEALYKPYRWREEESLKRKAHTIQEDKHNVTNKAADGNTREGSESPVSTKRASLPAFLEPTSQIEYNSCGKEDLGSWSPKLSFKGEKSLRQSRETSPVAVLRKSSVGSDLVTTMKRQKSVKEEPYIPREDLMRQKLFVLNECNNESEPNLDLRTGNEAKMVDLAEKGPFLESKPDKLTRTQKIMRFMSILQKEKEKLREKEKERLREKERERVKIKRNELFQL